MSEYIRKQAVLNLIDDLEFGNAIAANYDVVHELPKLYDAVKAIPPADVVEVVHAQWEETDWGTWGCTNCGCEWQFLEGLSPEENDAKYCPQCGARMDGDENA